VGGSRHVPSISALLRVCVQVPESIALPGNLTWKSRVPLCATSFAYAAVWPEQPRATSHDSNMESLHMRRILCEAGLTVRSTSP